MRNRLAVFFLCLLFACIGVPGCGEPQPIAKNDDGLYEVTLQLNWLPEAEHGGFYAALVHGYYEEAGLKVTIAPGGKSAPVVPLVHQKKMTFGVTNADQVLLGRAQGADVIAVMSPLQTSPRCILVHRKSGITKIDDLKNVTLAMSPGAAWAKFLQKKLPLPGVKVVPFAPPSQFAENPNLAIQGYVFSEPLTARELGADPVPLMVSDLGFNPYTSLLIAHADTIKENPEIVRKMTEATIRGWKKYLEDPAKTNEHIHSLNKEMSLKALAFGATEIKPLCITADVPADKLGRMTAERWKALSDQLIEVDVLESGKADANGAFTLQFLKSN